jgi:hypothetical protein
VLAHPPRTTTGEKERRGLAPPPDLQTVQSYDGFTRSRVERILDCGIGVSLIPHPADMYADRYSALFVVEVLAPIDAILRPALDRLGDTDSLMKIIYGLDIPRHRLEVRE